MSGYVKANSNNLPNLDIFMVHEFLKRDDRFNLSEIKGTKASHSMREEYGDNAIGYVEVKRDGDICNVRGKVCPEHSVRKPDYTVELVVDEENELVTDVFCNSCAAAAGGCKHALAFLMWAHRRSEEPSPTDIVSYWQKPVMSKIGSSIKFMKVSDFPSSRKRKIEDVENRQDFFNESISEGQKQNIDCQLMRYQPQRQKYDLLSIHKLIQIFKLDGKSSFEDFIELAESHVKEKYLEAERDTRSQSKSGLWFELRYGRITASKIYEVSRCKTSDGALVSSIIGAYKNKPTKAMLRGIKLEERVLRAVEKKLSVTFEKSGVYLIPEHPVFGATPDAITKEYVVEVKCPSTQKSFQTYIKKKVITEKYKAQVHLQMMAAQKKKALFIVAKPDFEESNDFENLWVEYDEHYIKKIVELCILFYKNNIFNKLLAG